MKTRTCFMTLVMVLAMVPAAAWAAAGAGALPNFDAVALTGERVTEEKLVGQPTILIVTPSKEAAQETRAWAKALRGRIDKGQVRVRDVLAIDLPFFMSERDALSLAKERIPQKYHDMTWLTGEDTLENALGIPTGSETATVLVLDSQGQIIARVSGGPTRARIEEVVQSVSKITS